MQIPFGKSWRRRLSARRRMREDWDLRARENARYYIDCGHGESEESFWKSGEEDVARSILRDIRISRDAVAIEIGCGIGRLLRPIAGRVREAIGVDISPEMIGRGRQALSSLSNARLEVTDGDLGVAADASADFVFSFIVFQHIPSRRAISRYFGEAARVLGCGGIFRFQVDGRPDHVRVVDTWNGVHFRARDLAIELEKLGLDIADISGDETQYMWVTAIRRSEPGRRATDAVSFRPRPWEPAAVATLVRRLGGDPERDAPGVLTGKTAPRALAQRFLVENAHADAPDYVAKAYRAILGREPDEAGLTFYASEIAQGIDRTNVLDCLFASDEFADRHRAKRPEETPD